MTRDPDDRYDRDTEREPSLGRRVRRVQLDPRGTLRQRFEPTDEPLPEWLVKLREAGVL